MNIHLQAKLARAITSIYPNYLRAPSHQSRFREWDERLSGAAWRLTHPPFFYHSGLDYSNLRIRLCTQAPWDSHTLINQPLY